MEATRLDEFAKKPEVRPEPCRRSACQLYVFGRGEGVIVRHVIPEGPWSEYTITVEKLHTVDLDIWGESVKPWIEGLHQAAA